MTSKIAVAPAGTPWLCGWVRMRGGFSAANTAVLTLFVGVKSIEELPAAPTEFDSVPATSTVNDICTNAEAPGVMSPKAQRTTPASFVQLPWLAVAPLNDRFVPYTFVSTTPSAL